MFARIVLKMIVAAVAFSVCGGVPAQSAEQRYPVKAIRLISPFAPGGGASTVARMIGPELTEAWGQSVVVDNRPGAGGSIGTELAARSPADGYTLLMATASTIVINPLVSKVPFDPVRDFTPVIHTTTVPLVLVVHPSVPAKSVKELLAHAAHGRLNFASSGEGTTSHLAAELFKGLGNVTMTHVPYKGGGQAIIDLMAGHVQTGFVNILEALPQVNAGRLRALAVSTSKRSPVAASIPTVSEAGVGGYEVIQWSGVLAPAGMPKAITIRLNEQINRILNGVDMRTRLMDSGADPGGGSPEQFSALIQSEIAKWSKVVKSVKLDGLTR
ncbi:MAG: tripartite tricarboxylate transporter substrate binding protein [Pseudomonadota bacterium]